MGRPRKTTNEVIETAFTDLDLTEQAQTLEILASLHRMCRRERARKPQPLPYDPEVDRMPAACDLPLEREQ